MIVAMAIVGVIAAACMIVIGVTRRRKKAVLNAVAEEAFAKLGDVPLDVMEIARSALNRRVRDGDVSILRAYANLLGHADPIDIMVTAHFVTIMNTGRLKTSIKVTPETMTVEHVQAYLEIRSMPLRESENFPMSEYVLNNIQDRAEVFSIIRTRGIKDVKEIQKVLADMRNSPSGALAEGTL